MRAILDDMFTTIIRLFLRHAYLLILTSGLYPLVCSQYAESVCRIYRSAKNACTAYTVYTLQIIVFSAYILLHNHFLSLHIRWMLDYLSSHSYYLLQTKNIIFLKWNWRKFVLSKHGRVNMHVLREHIIYEFLDLSFFR